MVTREHIARQRAAEALARADRTLAEPRPQPEPGEWRVPAREIDTAPIRQPPPRQSMPAVTRAEFDQRLRSMEAAVGRLIGNERRYWTLRVTEAERRITELESKDQGQ